MLPPRVDVLGPCHPGMANALLTRSNFFPDFLEDEPLMCRKLQHVPAAVRLAVRRSAIAWRRSQPYQLAWEQFRFSRHSNRKRSRSFSHASLADRVKEESMLFRRTIYDQEDWIRHRSSFRHGRNILSIASSRVIVALGPPVLSLTLIATVVAAYNEIVLMNWLPSWVPLLHVPSLSFQLTAPALSLLLVFRTNASYARFDEARQIWGSNVSRSRDIARQALCWIQHPQDSERLTSFLRHCIALSFCLKNHLRREENLEELAGVLDHHELEAVLASRHRPNHVLQTMSEIVHTCNLTEMERALLDGNITKFHDNVGACERIFNTPIPLSYTRLTSRFLVIWHAALPLALWDECSWTVVPATFFSAGALFCIEEVGVLIEDPFPIIALANICAGIRNSVEGLVQAHADFVTFNKQMKSKDERVQCTKVNGSVDQGAE